METPTINRSSGQAVPTRAALQRTTGAGAKRPASQCLPYRIGERQQHRLESHLRYSTGAYPRRSLRCHTPLRPWIRTIAFVFPLFDLFGVDGARLLFDFGA